MRLSPLSNIILLPACSVRLVALALAGSVQGEASVIFCEACRRIVEYEFKEAGFNVKVAGALPSRTVPEVALDPVLLSVMFAGSRNSCPPVKPGCALASMLEFRESTLGALTSTLPPFPPLAPPVAVI